MSKQIIKVSYKPSAGYSPVTPLKKISVGDFIDLRAAEAVRMFNGDSKLISLGVAIQLPPGYYAMLVPRSSTFKKYSIIMTNSIGIIDESYNGDNDIWRFPAFALRDTFIPYNERIAQFTIVKKNDFDIEEVDMLNNSDRGGFGSTGSK